MDIYSFETAKKLKAVGYPEPDFGCWQVWYNEFSIGTFLGRKVEKNGKMHFHCYSLGSGRTDEMILFHGEGCVFAPTAADIMKEMKGVFLSPIIGDCWGVFKIGTSIMVGFHPENPAEACAEAYLSNSIR